ncbi:MAG: diadenylate cyclase CdaA [Vicinamibacterales bacterium]
MNQLTALLHRTPMTWWDVVDILVVAIAIYEFLKFIQGTRAVQMAVGSGLLALLFFVSQLAPLQTVDWIVRNIVGYVVFAAIVIFQGDVRRALAHFGRAPFIRRLTRTESGDERIEEIVEAATILAARNIGAIIALERDIGLRNFVESGIPLDARLTYDLLVSVFQPTSPLHDGAVIIQEDRVAAAACFLPLTVHAQKRELGSRHRAAIGLTEETDAVVVVVSEETSTIGLALEGRIDLRIPPDELRERLWILLNGRRLPPPPSGSASADQAGAA